MDSIASSKRWATGSRPLWSSSFQNRAAQKRRATECSKPRRISRKNGLDFAKHAVAVTGVGSDLDKYAEQHGWLARFPMHDWVGGRTSVMSAVGLLPAALLGFDIDDFLAGAAAMDAHTRVADVRKNAAMLLALMWYYAGNGRGEKDMVILPYKDRLALFSQLSSATCHGVVRQRKRPRRQGRASGHRRLRQQRIDRSTRLRAATA